MKFEFKDLTKKKQAVLITAIIAVLCGVLNSFLGEIFLPPTAALLAALFLFENGGKRIFSYVVPSCLVIINVFIGGIYSVLGIAPIILALIIYFMYKNGRNKSECAVALTATAGVLILLSLYFAAVNATESFDFEAIKGFYIEIYEELKAGFVNQLSELSTVNPELESPIFTEDELALIFDSIAGQLISMLVIVSFLIAGVALKLFSLLIYRFEKEPHVIVGWRFKITNVFAYFYAILLLLNIFVGSGLGVVELVIINLYNIFMAIFAYFGFMVAREFLSRGRSGGFGTVMLVIGIFLLSALALQILSVIGLIYTIIDNKNKGNTFKEYN